MWSVSHRSQVYQVSYLSIQERETHSFPLGTSHYHVTDCQKQIIKYLLLSELTKYKHHGTYDRQDAPCSLGIAHKSASKVIMGGVVQSGVVWRSRARRARCGVRNHGESQSGQKHQHARCVQQSLASCFVHQKSCHGNRAEAQQTHDGSIIPGRYRNTDMEFKDELDVFRDYS